MYPRIPWELRGSHEIRGAQFGNRWYAERIQKLHGLRGVNNAALWMFLKT
jgi:hypothetical protein